MIDDDGNRRRQKIVNEDIKRILIDRDITTIKQTFGWLLKMIYKFLCNLTTLEPSAVNVP
jgi:hypothetical protein